ncbi:MAG: ferredoxin--NADP reductase [Chitinophagaceae bacterium]|nr:ferredoxin--NADP reductase [Chitinophagaceae bacterium]
MERILQLRIVDIIPETEETFSFVLEEMDGNEIHYKAGQFLTLIFTINNREVRRSYSISSTPGVNEKLQISVKRVHNGEISRHLIDHYTIGDIVEALAPSGMFVLNAGSYKDKDVLLLAAGSGITPIISLIKELLYKRNANAVVLMYQNRSNHSTIFRKEIQKIADDFSTKFSWLDFRSSDQGNIFYKRLNNEKLALLIPRYVKHDPAKASFFICGPESFMRMCQYTITLMGFNSGQIKKEHFVIDKPPAPPLIVNPQPAKVSILQQHITFETMYPKTILQSALDQHIALPYSCKGGRCSTCAAKCVSGEVIMSMNDVLTEKDIEAGLILTCVGYAVTDIMLEYNTDAAGKVN